LRWLLRGVALAAVIVCAVGFVSRALPEVLATDYDPGDGRLNYPILYANALGLLGVLGAIIAVHLTSDEGEPWPVRVLGAAALPVLCVSVYLTFSRAALVAGVVGLAAYLVLGRPRLVVSGGLSAGAASAVALSTTYAARALASTDHIGPAVVSQGRHVAQTVALCTIAAGALRAVLLAADARILRRPAWISRRAGWAAAAVLVATVSVAFAVSGGPRHLAAQYDVFVSGPISSRDPDLRSRFLDASSNGRPAFWRLAVRTGMTEPLHGHGAGTYQQLWHRHRPFSFQLFDGHSLYLETLAELGFVGLGLVAVLVLTLLFVAARRIRGPHRPLFALVFALLATWALRAGVDWDWEMPVVTLGVVALGGAVLGVRASSGQSSRPGVRRGHPGVRLAAGVGCLLLAVVPARMALSQHHLDRAVTAFQRDDCTGAIEASLASIRAIDARPEPYQLLAYCDAARGYRDLAVRAMDAAVSRDPGEWEYRYGLAVVRAAAGLDPRRAAREARERNPRDPLARDAVELFDTEDPRLWRTRALTIPLPPI
jgi:O-antigen ligase